MCVISVRTNKKVKITLDQKLKVSKMRHQFQGVTQRAVLISYLLPFKVNKLT